MAEPAAGADLHRPGDHLPHQGHPGGRLSPGHHPGGDIQLPPFRRRPLVLQPQGHGSGHLGCHVPQQGSMACASPPPTACWSRQRAPSRCTRRGAATSSSANTLAKAGEGDILLMLEELKRKLAAEGRVRPGAQEGASPLSLPHRRGHLPYRRGSARHPAHPAAAQRGHRRGHPADACARRGGGRTHRARNRGRQPSRPGRGDHRRQGRRVTGGPAALFLGNRRTGHRGLTDPRHLCGGP